MAFPAIRSAKAWLTSALPPRVSISKVIDLELDPGDVALWNVFTVHGSGRNSTQGDRRFYINGYVRAADCDRGEYAFRNGEPAQLGAPVLVHYEDLHRRPEPHFVED